MHIPRLTSLIPARPPAPLARPGIVDAPATGVSDRFEAGAAPPPEPESRPSTPPKRPDYLWEGAAIGGWMGAALGAVVSFGPIPGWLGLEPPPARDPHIQPLAFDWAGCGDADFARHCRHLEQALESGQEAGKKRLGGGGNRSYLVELDSGPLAIWKPKAGQQPGQLRNQIPPDRDEGKVEAAAYLVDRALGHLARVPCATADGWQGRPGTLGVYLPQTVPAKDLGDRDMLYSLLKPEDTRRITLFDHVVGNLDRHGGNWLIDPRGRPIPIDHGLAFPERNSDQGTHNFDFHETFALNAAELQRLRGLVAARPELERELAGLISPAAVQAMYARVERMLETGHISQEWRV